MSRLANFASTGARLMIIAAIPTMLVAATPAQAQRASVVIAQEDVGSANPAFRRHFWRGQLNHGSSASEGYAVYNPATGLYLDADG